LVSVWVIETEATGECVGISRHATRFKDGVEIII